MTSHRHTQPILQSQDSDSGLSMPSGTLRSTLTFTGATPRMAEEDHERLIQSLLQRTMDSPAPSASAFSFPTPAAHSSTPKKSDPLGESFLQSQRPISPAMSSKARHSPFLRSGYLSDTFGVAGGADMFNNSMDRMSATLGLDSHYLAGGLKNSLYESQTRRTALLEKLKEAQDTLQLQSTRLSKMETDYHSSSYQVEELKANESKLLRQLAQTEQQKQELNDLRVRDIDVQLALQDRIKELEGALRNMATDFQLLEADHARRRELVDQLSTTVELVEEENKKLHKSDIEDWIVEHSIHTEVQCLRTEINTALEEKEAYKSQMDSQRRETKHWKEENENMQKSLRQSQDIVSEMKVKVNSLTHKLEGLQARETELLKDNETLRSKDREQQDTMTDLRSRVAIVTSDKERLYQEQIDLHTKIESVTLLNKQLQEEVQGLQLTSRKYTHEMEIKDKSISQLTDTNHQLKDELIGSQKVGENLSLELTRTKEQLNRFEENMSQTKSELAKESEAKQKLEGQYRTTHIELTKLQTEKEYSSKQFSQEKRELKQEVDKLQDDLWEHARNNKTLEDKIVSLNQRLNASQELSSQQITQLESGIKLWKEKYESSESSVQKKDEEIATMSRKMAEYDSQMKVLLIEQEAKRIEYDKYKQLQEENQRLTLLNRRITQDNAESEQMVQLLQTQRDIYARSVQEYTGKALQADQVTEENKQLHTTIENLRNAEAKMVEELNTAKELRNTLQEEVQVLNNRISAMKCENNERKQEKDKLEQENSLLKNAVQESYQLKQQLSSVESNMAACQVDKTVIAHLTKQNTALNGQVEELKNKLDSVTRESQTANLGLSQAKQTESKQCEDIKSLEYKLRIAERSADEWSKQLREMEDTLHQSELARANLNSQLTRSQTQTEKVQQRLEDQQIQLTKSSSVENQCQKLQQEIKELTSQTKEAAAEKDSLLIKLNKLETEVHMANCSAEEQRCTNRQLTSDLSIASREKQQLQSEIMRLEHKIQEAQLSADNQADQMWVKNLREKLGEAEDIKLSTHQKTQLERQDSINKHRKLTNELAEKSEEIVKLQDLTESLRAELRESLELNARQENFISTLKEETGLLCETNKEGQEVKRKYKELLQTNEEQEQTIATLKKEAEQKEHLQKHLQEIGADLVTVKSELQRTYASMAQKELEMERLQQLYNNAVLDAENSEEKSAELKIRLDQSEKAREVTLTTLQEKIHSLEAEILTYKTEILKLEQQVADLRGRLSSTCNELNLTNDISALDKDSLSSVKAERDGLIAECSSLRAQNTKLLSEQNHLESEKRKAQLQLKETKIDMFRVEKEKENLERSNSRLDSSVTECNRLLKSLTSEFETTRTKLMEMERVNDRLQKKNSATKAEVADLLETGLEKDQLHQQIKQLNGQVSDLKAQLREIDFEQAKSSIPQQLTATEPISKSNFRDSTKLSVAITNCQFPSISAEKTEPSNRVNTSQSEKTEDSKISLTIPNNHPVSRTSASDKMSPLGEVLTDSSDNGGESDSLADACTQPELSDALSSGKLKDMDNTLEMSRPIAGNDEIDGSQSPFRVHEIPVTIAIEHGNSSISPRKRGEMTDYTLIVEQDTDTDSEEDSETAEVGSSSSGGLMLTRDKTMKIFKQLKKAKQRSKKCLAPTPKINKSLPELPKETRERENSFEKPNTKALRDEEAVESTDINHIKNDILAKSGRVEWRDDPREPHRRYLSSCDLSVIADAGEAEQEPDNSLAEETDSVSSEYTRSLLNLPSVSHTGSLESLQSVGAMDSPQLPRSTKPNSGTQQSPSLSSIETGKVDFQTKEETIPRKGNRFNSSKLPVSTSPQTSPLLSSKSSNKKDGKTKLPKMSLFKKNW